LRDFYIWLSTQNASQSFKPVDFLLNKVDGALCVNHSTVEKSLDLEIFLRKSEAFDRSNWKSRRQQQRGHKAQNRQQQRPSESFTGANSRSQ
jgi:hypothetical protein